MWSPTPERLVSPDVSSLMEIRGRALASRDSMITRDYITYLTSNSVLIGAEVDKIISILVFTAVLALASKRAARLLEFAAVESASQE